MIRLHVDVIGLQRLPLAPAIRAEMVADVARAARQAVRDSFQSMLDRTQSQGFWGKARQSVNPPVIRDNKATIDITHTGVRLQWLGGTVRPTERRSESMPDAPSGACSSRLRIHPCAGAPWPASTSRRRRS